MSYGSWKNSSSMDIKGSFDDQINTHCQSNQQADILEIIPGLAVRYESHVLIFLLFYHNYNKCLSVVFHRL